MLYSYRPLNDVIKCSKLKWNHKPQVLNILLRHFMVCKSIDHRKLSSICIYNNMEKVLVKLNSFSIDKARVTSDVTFVACTLIQTTAMSQAVRGNFDRYCKNKLVRLDVLNFV